MEAVREWLSQMICFLCLTQVILHLIPDTSLKKYVRFFLGILFLMIVLEPVGDLLGKDNFLETFQIQSLRGSLQDYESWEMGAEDIFPEWDEAAYQRELEERIEKIYQTLHIPQEDLHTDILETEVQDGENRILMEMEKSKKGSASDTAPGWDLAAGDRDSPW